MKKEELVALGLTEEQASQVLAINGKDIEKFKSTNDTQKTELEGLKTQLSDANKQIESFKGMDIDGIKKAADDYRLKFEAAEAQGKKDLEALQFSHALEGALTGAKARNATAVKALLNMEGLKLADGNIVGLNEQLEKIKQDNDYLFEADNPTPQPGIPQIVAPTGGNTPPAGDNPFGFSFTGVRPKPQQ